MMEKDKKRENEKELKTKIAKDERRKEIKNRENIMKEIKKK